MSELSNNTNNINNDANDDNNDNDDKKYKNEWKDIKLNFYLIASRKGTIGYQFIANAQKDDYEHLKSTIDDSTVQEKIKIKLNILNDTLRKLSNEINGSTNNTNKNTTNTNNTTNTTNATNITVNNSNSKNYDDDKMQFFFDMYEYIPDNAKERILDLLDDDYKISDDDTLYDVYCINFQYDYNKLWRKYKEAHCNLLEEIDYLKSEKFTLWNGFLSVMSNEYIEESWKHNHDVTDLTDDIVTVNSNLALLSALIVTLSVPLYGQSNDTITTGWYDNDYGICLYLYGIVSCSIFEIACLLTLLRKRILRNLLTNQQLYYYYQ